MSIELSAELEERVQNKIASGRYRSASDVLTDALELLEERDTDTALQRDDIRKNVGKGYESLRAGRGVEGDAVFKRIERELVAREPLQT